MYFVVPSDLLYVMKGAESQKSIDVGTNSIRRISGRQLRNDLSEKDGASASCGKNRRYVMDARRVTPWLLQ